MKRKVMITLFSFILITVCFVSCFKQDKQQTIKIGLIADLSGSMAMYGNWVKQGAEIAISEFDSKEVVLLIEDSKSDPKTATSSLEKLISFDKVKIYIAGNSSSCVMSMSPIVEKNKVLLFSTLASSPNITNAGEYVFRNRISGTFETESMAKKAFSLNLNKIVIVAMNNDAGQPYIEAFKNEFKKLSGIDVLGILVDPNTTNLNTQALQLKDYNPEAVFVAMPIAQAVNLIKVSQTINVNPQWLGISSLKADEFLNNGAQYVEGTIIANEGIDETNELYIDFAKKYKTKYNEEPNIYAINGYDAVKILVDLAKTKNSDVEEIRKALYDKNGFYTASGHVFFDSNGDVIKQIELLKVHNGKFERIQN